MYYCRAEGGRIAILITYVNDIAFSGNYIEDIQRMQTYLLSKYKGRDLGVPDKLLGIGITVINCSITLDQRLYAESIIIVGMGSAEVRTTYMPLDPDMDLSAREDWEEELDTFRFRCTRRLLEN